MKVLLINNYSMEDAWKLWEEGKYPGQHLWGATHLAQYGVETEILPYEKYGFLKKLSKKLGFLGDLDQQLRVLFHLSEYDILYSACQSNTFLLSILRLAGIYRKPMSIIVHHPIKNKEILKNKLLFTLLFNGHDQFLCLTKEIKQQFEEELSISPDRVRVIEWGTDLSFYDPCNAQHATNANPFIISAGKTFRDYDTLVNALNGTEVSLKIYCSGQSAPSISEFSSNIEVIFNHPTNNAISYRDLLLEYQKSHAIAIPLPDTRNLAGLTSLLDAMAMGKAVIITRNKQIDIDIEKEKIGLVVEPGDVLGWRDAVSYVIEHPEAAIEMGRRGRYLCEKKYNLDVFSSNLASCFREVDLKN
jgi:glycosyltransferase involved in cell wall biosynthesis